MSFQEAPPIEVNDFSGGINQSTTADNIADNEMEDCLNMNLLIDKSLESRGGVDQYNSTLTGSSRVTSLYYARTTSGGSVARIVTTLAKVYKDNGSGGWTDITGATVPPSNTLWQWRTFNNVAIGVNGTTVPQKYAFGAALADLAGSPPDKCAVIEVYSGRVYLAKDTDEPTALHASAVDNGEDWTSVGDAFTVFVDKDNGHPVVGVIKFFDDLIILKRKGVYRLINPDNEPTNMRLVQIFDDVGCISPYSIKQVGNELAWIDDDGVYTLRTTQNFGDVAYAALSKEIQDFIDDTQLSILTEAYATDIRKLNQVRWAVPKLSATENNRVLVRDYYHKAWLAHEGINYASFGKWEISGILYDMAGGYDGKVYKLDKLDSDEGAAFTKRVKTKRFNFGSSRMRKWFHRVYQEFQTNGTYSIGFTADIDYSKVIKGFSLVDPSVRDQWDVGQWDVARWGGQSVARKFVTLGKKGRNIQLQYLNTQADQPFSLHRIAIEAAGLGRKG